MDNVYKQRKSALEKMGVASYEEYLKSETWDEIKRQVFAAKGYGCSCCRKFAKEIHHQSYDLETMQGRTLAFLWPVCRQCHRKTHFRGDVQRGSADSRKTFVYMRERYLESEGMRGQKPVKRTKKAKKLSKKKLAKRQRIQAEMRRDKEAQYRYFNG